MFRALRVILRTNLAMTPSSALQPQDAATASSSAAPSSFRLDKRRPETLERTQRGAQVLVRLRHPERTQPLRLPPGPAHDAVVSFHDRIGNRGPPFEGTDREDSETPFAGELSDTV